MRCGPWPHWRGTAVAVAYAILDTSAIHRIPGVVAGMSAGGARAALVLADPAGLALIVVDGYADLDPHGRPGLGAHLHADLNIPVIGVAKTPFHSATHAIKVYRGAATRPLYVTATGLPTDEAAALVTRTAGRYRISDALRRADTLARGNQPPLPPPRPTTG
jgi:deoxyinosine 3'endonuclease (endonuclease V)